MKQILKIAIPNGMENGIFQLVKVALSGIVALFGTYQIAANGVAQSIWSLAALAGVAMGPVFITVIGQCMGNGDADAAEHYFKRLTRIIMFLFLKQTPDHIKQLFKKGCSCSVRHSCPQADSAAGKPMQMPDF